mmetsp:Transcript_81014/g.261785  ORF Transcript_81014/g.261785 Transcript_81014/m.261785 type:complete len:227 (-) Transcript_81014:241-921(-)
MANVSAAQLSKEQKDELLCTYAALILHDDGAEVTPQAMTNLIKATGATVESYWPMLMAKMINNIGMDALIKMGSGGGGGGNRANGVGLNRGNPADVAKVDVVPMGPDAVAAPTAVCASAPKRALADCRKPVPSSACPGASEGEAPNAAPAPAAAEEEEDTAAPPRPSSGLSKCSERPRYSTRFWKCSSRSAGSASGGGHAPDPPSNRRSRRARSTRRKETGSKSRK